MIPNNLLCQSGREVSRVVTLQRALGGKSHLFRHNSLVSTGCRQDRERRFVRADAGSVAVPGVSPWGGRGEGGRSPHQSRAEFRASREPPSSCAALPRHSPEAPVILDTSDRLHNNSPPHPRGAAATATAYAATAVTDASAEVTFTQAPTLR